MNIFDSHLHLQNSKSLKLSFETMFKECQSAGVSGGLVIKMPQDQWDFRDVSAVISEKGEFKLVVCPDLTLSAKQISREIDNIKASGAIALKIHPRIQGINLESKVLHRALRAADENSLSVVICSFDDGSWGRLGLEPRQFLDLADNFPKIKFLWAHAGGHRVIDFMFMARRTENVFLDTSFTQTYFFKGRVLEDLNYATESLPSRFLFGTDFEKIDYQNTVSLLTDFFLKENTDRYDLFEGNFRRFVSDYE